jgi:hypothetical protein
MMTAMAAFQPNMVIILSVPRLTFRPLQNRRSRGGRERAADRYIAHSTPTASRFANTGTYGKSRAIEQRLLQD